MTDAYSLIRMSTLDQAKGDSIRRQELLTLSERFCTDNGLNLVETLRVIGKSAFHGHHVASGPLADFLKLVEAAKIKPGSWLLVEDMDRLDRRKINVALRQFLTLLEAGVVIHTFIDNQTYTLERVNEDQTALIISIVKMAAAHDYSKKLSNRIKSVWAGRREAMRAGKGVATNACPGWLEAVDCKFVERRDRVAVVKRIIAYRHLGLGRKAIATRLNDKDQPGGRVPTFKGGFGWHPTTIAKIVKNQALIGIYQPRKADGSEDGEPIEGFYPRIISDHEFWSAQWGPDNKLSRGRTSKGLWNLLKGIVKCECCGRTIIGLNTGKEKFLICDAARYNLCENHNFQNYPQLEAELLPALAVLDFTRLLDPGDPQARRIAALETEIANKSATIDRLVEDFSAATPAAVSRRIALLSEQINILNAELADAKKLGRMADAQKNRDAYAEFQSMVKSLPHMPDDESRYELRARAATELRRIIGEATAVGTELKIALKESRLYRIELWFKRSILDSVRLVSIQDGFSYVFTRDTVIGDPDLAGLFAGYLGPEDVEVA